MSDTLRLRADGGVLFAEIAAPPMNLLEPELVRDLVSLIRTAEADTVVRVVVFTSALPAAELAEFVNAMAHRIAGLPAATMAALKDRVNAIALAPADDFRSDSDLFGVAVREREAQTRLQNAMRHGFQTREAELDLGRVLPGLVGM